jgi:uncharacterized protein (TIGR03086 family)
MDPIAMFEQAATDAASTARSVTTSQRARPTPCTEWNVATLLEHMAGGPVYLLAALGIDPSTTPAWPDRAAITTCVDALREPGALERRCMSPAGFECSVAEAAAGTAMDQFVHTWDLRTALGEDAALDDALAEVIVEMFLPHMPEVGRQAGFVGPAVAVDAGAPAADRLLGAMGRRP